MIKSNQNKNFEEREREKERILISCGNARLKKRRNKKQDKERETLGGVRLKCSTTDDGGRNVRERNRVRDFREISFKLGHRAGGKFPNILICGQCLGHRQGLFQL